MANEDTVQCQMAMHGALKLAPSKSNASEMVLSQQDAMQKRVKLNKKKTSFAMTWRGSQRKQIIQHATCPVHANTYGKALCAAEIRGDVKDFANEIVQKCIRLQCITYFARVD